MIREGTLAKNLRALLPIVSAATVGRCSLVTDDLHPHDLLHKGHLNHLIDLAAGEGIDPLLSIVMVTLSTARFFGFRDLGAVAPGYRADILILSSLSPVTVRTVIKNGRIVYDGGRLTAESAEPPLYELPVSHEHQSLWAEFICHTSGGRVHPYNWPYTGSNHYERERQERPLSKEAQ